MCVMYLDLNKVWLDSKRETEYVTHNTKAIQNIINTDPYQQMHYEEPFLKKKKALRPFKKSTKLHPNTLNMDDSEVYHGNSYKWH